MKYIYVLIKCIKSFFWREQERLSYIDAWCLKVSNTTRSYSHA